MKPSCSPELHLVAAMICEAIESAKTLSGWGIIRGGQVIGNEKWPRWKNGSLRPVCGYRNTDDVEALVSFLKSNLCEQLISACGVNVAASEIRKTIGV